MAEMQDDDYLENCDKGISLKKSKSTKSRKKPKSRDPAQDSSSMELSSNSFTDFMCPICLQLLIKPVVLPCKHELCMPCFQSHISETSLQCPMCRKRISVWARHKKKEGNFVDEARWALIQKLFPERCQRRLNGEDDPDDDLFTDSNYFPVISNSGEIRQEYEKELEKIREERRQESIASEEIVRKLQEEEEQHANVYSEQEKDDENLALQLQQEEVNQTSVTITSLSATEKEILSTFGKLEARNLRNRDPTSLSSPQGRSSATNTKKKSSKGQRNATSTTPLSSPSHSSSMSSPKGTILPKTKENAQISRWFTKEDSPTSTPADAARPTSSLFAKLQEERDHEFALKLQQQLDDIDAEMLKLPRMRIEDHFYPLQDKKQNSNNLQEPKRQRLK